MLRERQRRSWLPRTALTPELWWAHTGGGGGNFGIVTRYLLRSHNASGNRPDQVLPRPPQRLLTAAILIPWAQLTEDSFIRFVGNYLAFFEDHRAPDSPFASLYAPLLITPRGERDSIISIQLDADHPDAKQLLREFVSAVTAGIEPTPTTTPAESGQFLETTLRLAQPLTNEPPRSKFKAAYLRRAYTDDQLHTLHRHLTDPAGHSRDSLVLFVPYGGRVNTRPTHATAMPQRDSFMKMVIAAGWRDPAEDDRYLTWTRHLYHDLYADTGGVPVPNDRNDGTYINYPDSDTRDPRWNASSAPWHQLYYGSNYPRLQQIKGAWDPHNLFRHQLSVEAG